MPFHSFAIGDFEVLSIQAQPDRVVDPREFFPDATSEELERLFATYPSFFGASASELRFTQNIFVVRADGKTILVDTGIPLDSPGAGLLPGLAEAGITPEDVDLVVLTHRDLDHVGGNLRDGKPTYANARYVIGRTEYEDFKADTGRAESFGKYIEPLTDLEVLTDDAEIAPGIRLWLTPGHRSGANSVRVGDVAVLTADTWHSPIQVAHPEWSIRFDSDPELAAATRKSVIEQGEREGWLFGVPHTPFFGLGRIVDGAWQPVVG